MGEHGQGDVPVPARIPADLILVQAALVLRGLEGFLDRPAGPGDAHEFGDGSVVGRVGEVELNRIL